MNRNITVASGLVTRVIALSRNVSSVTVFPVFDVGYTEISVPVYVPSSQEYLGKYVDIINSREGFRGRQFKQTVKSSDGESIIEIPYSVVLQINLDYNRKMGSRRLQS